MIHGSEGGGHLHPTHSSEKKHFVPVKSNIYNRFAAMNLKILGSDLVNEIFAFLGNKNAQANVHIRQRFNQVNPPITKIHGGDTIDAFDELIKKAKEVKPLDSPTKVSISNLTCVDVAKSMADDAKGKNKPIAILNLANRIRPGSVGDTYREGSLEEALFRQSNLRYGINRRLNTAFDRALSRAYKNGDLLSDSSKKMKQRHHIPNFGALHSKNVTFVKDQPNRIRKDYNFDVISVAGIDLRPTAEEHSHYIKKTAGSKPELDKEKFKEVTQRKAEAILATALINGDRNVVLSAMGCGAFKNDPWVVADCFKKALEKEEFKDKFENVVFAIYVPGQADPNKNKNYSVFSKTFS